MLQGSLSFETTVSTNAEYAGVASAPEPLADPIVDSATIVASGSWN
jgi:hypothetical protein